MKQLSLRYLLIAISLFVVNCVEAKTSVETLIYKEVDNVELALKVYQPESEEFEGARPSVVFFFGGGWNAGSIDQFKQHAEHYAELGMVAITVDYRVKSRHNATPFDCVEDAKSAMRYIRSNAKALGVDPSKIAASGGSAGGHLAAATALIDGYNCESDDMSVDPRPNALLLFNPVVDNGPAGYGYDRVGENYREFSPLFNLRRGVPPTIIFLGSEDALIPEQTIRYYQTAMRKLGSKCEVHIYEGAKHGFFNSSEYKATTIGECDTFLRSLGYIE